MGEAPPLRALTARLPALLALVAAILVADALAPAGVVVGILAAVPILLASTCTLRRDVLLVAGAAGAGKVLETLVGGAAVTPPEFWIPNRAIVFLSIPASASLSLLLQRGRLAAEAAAGAARRERELNRLLMSLLAHDLRAPLVVARQCIAYVSDALARGATVRSDLMEDTATRLDRSLRAIEIVLSVAGRGGGDAIGDEGDGGPAPVDEVIRTEVESFRGEAGAQGKHLTYEVPPDVQVGRGLVLRQALAILLDNAIRYAVPGEVVVSAAAGEGCVRVTVRDGGPAAEGVPGLPRGAGLGLQLSRTLLTHAGGSLDVAEAGGGTAWTITLPERKGG